ncbi:sugar ABC transporter substrate-binding protein [Microbacterium sp. CIAB417]|uniref:sugar ABC transporter substrate-binding protein n=1 Tax=Microbacterium sp. CIAB417 TaxID=2860287 RepID=UPI001FACB641|nr:sugar ABC transporter substrate-binding protein [Microbacterium sp. CIAB417]
MAVAAIAGLAVVASGCAIQEGGGGGETTLTFWNYYSGTQLDWLKEQAATFEDEHPGVTVNLVQTVGSQHDQKLLASVATDSTPDLFINNIVVDFPTLVAGGVMLDLTDYWDDFDAASEFPDNAAWRSDDKVYNLMSYTNLLGMYYNKDILDEYGIAVPETLDELTAAMETVAAGGEYQGVALSGAASVEGAWLFAPQFLGLGVDYCNLADNADIVGGAFDRVAQWREEGLLPQAAATWDQNASWQQFMTGKYAFGLNGNWQLGNVKDAAFEYGTTQFPAPEGGVSQVFPGGEGFAIGSKSKNPDLAWEFVEQMIMSQQGGESVFEFAGSIPLNSGAAGSEAVAADPFVQPFVTAAQATANWPNNPETSAMQKALGTAVSSVISGQSTAAEATDAAIDDISAAMEKGGGTCS